MGVNSVIVSMDYKLVPPPLNPLPQGEGRFPDGEYLRGKVPWPSQQPVMKAFDLVLLSLKGRTIRDIL